MGNVKQVGTWGSSTLLGYSTAPYSKNYYRIVEANKRAKAMGISYGKYMAGLWEENERIPIIQNDFEKYKKKPKQPKLLEGEEAAEYIRKLKVKAGTYEEPVATAGTRSGAENEKAKLLNARWSASVKKLRENPEKVKNIKMVRKGKEKKMPQQDAPAAADEDGGCL